MTVSSREASRLLAGAVPAGADPEAIERVAHRCGYLPLALTVVAGRMAAMPGWTVADHADRLDERHRNHRLDDGVQLALHLSDQRLPGRRRVLLRRLAGHPGQDLDAYAAAALLDAELDETEEHLRRLTADHLVQQPSPVILDRGLVPFDQHLLKFICAHQRELRDGQARVIYCSFQQLAQVLQHPLGVSDRGE